MRRLSPAIVSFGARLIAASAFLLFLIAPAPMPAAARQRSFFHVARIGDAWWFIDPDGRRFLSIGVNAVDSGSPRYAPVNPEYSALHSYGSLGAWQTDTLTRLSRWRFNTLGAWSEPALYARDRMPFAVCLHLGSTAGLPWVDMWDPEIEASVDDLAHEMTAPWHHSRELIGYFTDNENPWWDETLFAYFMDQPLREVVEAGRSKVNRTKQLLLRLIDGAYRGDMRQFSRDWWVPESVHSMVDLQRPVEIERRAGTRPPVLDAFMDALYERYEYLVSHAVHQADPVHLLLGERYPQYYNPRLAAIAGRYNDVISANVAAWTADGWVPRNWMAALGHVSGRPVLVSEFYIAANDNTTGNTNTHGSFPIVGTQRERAAVYAAQVQQMASMPDLVGWHWFQYYDEPARGRPDGENYNMGLVDVENRPYPIVSTASAVNANAVVWHSAAHATPSGAPFRFRVPAAPVPEVDGVLREWNKAASWLPGVRGAPLNASLGDLFVSASPGRLSVALIYQSLFRDTSFVHKPPSGWPETECETFRVVVTTSAGAPIADVKLRRQVDGDGWSLEPGESAAVVAAGRGNAVELSIAVPDVGQLRFSAELQGRANAQEIYWGGRSPWSAREPFSWGTLFLPTFPGPRR